MQSLPTTRCSGRPTLLRSVPWFLLAVLLMGLFSLNVWAATYEDQGIRLTLPEGFEGPISGTVQGAKVVGFIKQYPGDNRGTLLQVTTYDFGAALAGMPEDARTEANEKYLAQFLDGVGQARQSFRIVSRQAVLIGGIKAARADWVGDSKGRPMSGVMFCVIVGSRVVVFHTQDFSDAPPENRKAALKAIESVSFTKD